jgi:tetratricopeptide (TPR) repeat protein
MVQDSGQPDPEREEQLMREAAALARRLGDPEVIASVDFGFAELELALGKTAEARTRIEAALAAYERFGSPGSVGWCHDHLGWVEVAEFDYRRAHSHFERAAQLARVEGGDQWLAAHALAALAPLAVLVGDPERGSRLADEAVAAARSLPTPAVLYMSLARAAETAILAGSFRQAGDILGELLGLLRDVRSRRWLADALEMAALVLEFRDHPVTAVEVLGASAALRASSGEKHGGSRALAAEVRRSRDRLGAMLGPDRFANHQARGGKVPPEAVTDQVLARLGTGSFGGPNLEEGALRRRA